MIESYVAHGVAVKPPLISSCPSNLIVTAQDSSICGVLKKLSERGGDDKDRPD